MENNLYINLKLKQTMKKKIKQIKIFLSTIITLGLSLVYVSCEGVETPVVTACSTTEPIDIDTVLPKTTTSINLWDNGLIKYYIDPSFSEDQKNLIRQAAYQWTTKTNAVLLIEVSSMQDSQTIHILKNEINPPLAPEGVVSTIKFVSLRSNSDLITIKHELGHLIGLIHEHQRVGRNNYLTFPKKTWDYIFANKPQDIIEKVKINLSEQQINYVDDNPIDPTSIMMYASYARNSQALFDLQDMQFPLYVIKSDCSEIERPTDISAKDIKLVKKLYPRKVTFQNLTNDNITLYAFGPTGNMDLNLNPQSSLIGSIDGASLCFEFNSFKVNQFNAGASIFKIAQNGNFNFINGWISTSTMIENIGSTWIPHYTDKQTGFFNVLNTSGQGYKKYLITPIVDGNSIILKVTRTNDNS